MRLTLLKRGVLCHHAYDGQPALHVLRSVIPAYITDQHGSGKEGGEHLCLFATAGEVTGLHM